jgi:hypothetical protein
MHVAGIKMAKISARRGDPECQLSLRMTESLTTGNDEDSGIRGALGQGAGFRTDYEWNRSRKLSILGLYKLSDILKVFA